MVDILSTKEIIKYVTLGIPKGMKKQFLLLLPLYSSFYKIQFLLLLPLTF